MVVRDDHKGLWATIIITLIIVIAAGIYVIYKDEIMSFFNKNNVDSKPVITMECADDCSYTAVRVNGLEEGINSDQFLSFDVKSVYNVASTIDYSLIINEDLPSSYYVYLTEVVDGSEALVVPVTKVLYLNSYAEFNDNLLLYKGEANFSENKNTDIHSYRLRVFTLDDDELKKAEVSVSEKKFTDVSACFILSENKIVGYKCYAGNNYNMPVVKRIVIANKINNIKVNMIDENAFYDSEKDRGYGLTKVVISDGIGVANNAFRGNDIEEVVLPNDIKVIGSKAFYNNKIDKISLPNSVITIEDEAFSNNLLTTLEIGPNVMQIRARAFANNSLTSVIINGKKSFEEFSEIDYNAFGFMVGYSMNKNVEFRG